MQIATPTALYRGVNVTSNTTSCIEANAGEKIIIKYIIINNLTGSAETIDIYLVDTAGGTPATADLLFSASISPDVPMQFDGTIVLEAGNSLVFYHSGSNTFACHAHGAVVS